MGIARWLRPPGRTLAVFLGLMLVIGAALAWLGWQWLKQDRALEGQRLQDRLEVAADHMAVALQQSLIDLESYRGVVPGPGAKEPPEDVLVLRGTKNAVEAYPPGRLLYYSALPDSERTEPAVFAAGEAWEFRRGDSAQAALVFRELTGSRDPGVRAGAWLRLGRNLRKIGRPEEALQAYDELARFGRSPVLGLPAELAAREARITVLEALGRRAELQREASLLRTALWSGRWSLLRPAWEFYAAEAQRRMDASAPTESERSALTLAMAADSLCGQWRAEPGTKGRRVLKIEGRPVLISWEGTPDRLDAVLAGPAYLDSKWTAVLHGRRVQGALIDEDGQVVIGSFHPGGPQAVRTAPASRLPGTLHATSPDPGADAAGLAVRRRLLFAGFVGLALFLLAGTYFIMRSIDRERAVARLQSEFVSAVSHEFRTPLTSLRQLSEMLAKGRIPEPGQRQKSYDILSRESERMQRLVESLLDFGRIEAGAFHYRFEPLDPGAWAGEVAAEFRGMASAQGFDIDLALEPDLPLVRADRAALGLALRSLLDNAVKYSPDGRTIWVELAREKTGLAIRVRDRGLGIPASEQKRIFERFVRGSGSRAAHVEGTGIGLAMARHIVDAHGGEIRLESEPGRGSTFTILLPLEKNT